MSSARRAAVLPLAVAVTGVLVASAPAYATVKATWGKPTDNSTFTTTDPVDFTVTLDRGATALTADSAAVSLNLAVPGPNPGPFKVDTSSGTGDRDLKFTFTPACPNHAGACASGSAPAYNGRYTASLTGATTGSRTVVLQVPPATPANVTATATGQHRVKVAWDANREPDLTAYDVFTSDGVTVAANLPASSTSYEFDLPSSGYGGTHGYVVRAKRLACANCSGPDAGAELASPMSGPATVTLTEPNADPDPAPSSDPGTGGGDGGYNGTGGTGNGSGGNGGGGTGNGGGSTGNGTGNGSGGGTSTDPGYNTGNTGGDFSSGETQAEQNRQAQRKLAFSLTFKQFAPKLGAPKLPPLPKFSAPTETLPWGTYDPTLNYGKQTILQKDAKASGGGFTNTVFDTFSTAFEGRRLFRSIAIALLLLLGAAHLRVWLRSAPTP